MQEALVTSCRLYLMVRFSSSTVALVYAKRSICPLVESYGNRAENNLLVLTNKHPTKLDRQELRAEVGNRILEENNITHFERMSNCSRIQYHPSLVFFTPRSSLKSVRMQENMHFHT